MLFNMLSKIKTDKHDTKIINTIVLSLKSTNMYQMQKVYQDTFDMRYDTLLEYIFIDIERGFNIQALHNAKLIPIMDESIPKMAVKMV